MGEQFQPHTTTKKWLTGIGIAIVLAGIGLAIYFALFYKSTKPPVTPYNDHQARVQALEKQGEPADPAAKIGYYSQLAQHYETLNNKDQALANYLKAQAIVDANTNVGQVVFYMPIAGLYKDKGDKAKTKTYYQKEITYLQQFASEHPEQAAGVNTTITTLQGEIKAL
jgi:flagellar basal body-associated protein FliL